MSNFVEPIGLHSTLNPKLWEGDDLRSEVRSALLRIALEFYRSLGVKVKATDIVITGSQANFNYSDHSDIDLHIIIPFSNVVCDEPVAELFEAKRKLWKEQHSIDIYNIPVELYVEDRAAPAISSVYSIVNNAWLIRPEQPKISYNVEKVEHLVNLWSRIIRSAIQSKNLDKCFRVLKLLVKFRRVGLKKYGEFGVPNLTFKSLRNSGILNDLGDSIRAIEDKHLSLD